MRTTIYFSAPTTCDDSMSLDGGKIDFPKGNGVGSIANYTCADDYLLEGAAIRTCQTDGTWSGTEPVCKRKFVHI